MVIIKLKGGLGNQMFQYTCARYLAEKNNDVLKLDLSWYRLDGIPSGDTVRHYGLDQFTISAQAASDEEIVRVGGRPSWFGSFVKKVVNKLRPITSYVFDPRVLARRGDVYLEGFFQSEKYFKDIESIIRNEFRLKSAMGEAAHLILQDIEQSNAISIHIRRGDYVTNNKASTFHGSCSPEYYRIAIDATIKRVELPKFFVFSDDIARVKENIKIPSPVVYVSNSNIADHEELILMSKCKHNIIANSSFSWWGAWLNEHPQKMVIAPKQWVSDPHIDTRDAIPAGWKII